MQIAVSGKGGSGKTTISGTLARLAGRRLGRVLAVDGDPNPNLAQTIGVTAPEKWDLIPGDLLTTVEDENGERRGVLAKPIEEIISQLSLAGPDGVQLLTMGEVDHAGEGWLCRAHATVREIVGATLETSDLPVILDMEASLEHMRRNTVKHIDTMLIVTEPYFRSLESARRLFRLANEIPIKNVFGVANKVRNTSEETAIRAFFDQNGLSLLAIIPYDEQICQADLKAQALIDFRGDAPAVIAIEQLLDKILELS